MIRDSDAKSRKREARERFSYAQRMEREYLRSLRHVVRQVDAMVRMSAPDGAVKDLPALQNMLAKYSDAIRPWAKSVAAKMVERIAKRDELAWRRLGKEIGRSLREEIEGAETGKALRAFMDEQVTLITSLPTEAGQRVHKLTLEALSDSTRASEIAKDILATGKVTESRAKLIARTEVARTASGLTLARAQYIGVTHYIWRTSGDSDVRSSHRKMNGKVVPFDAPPEVDPGKHYHAGMFPNCRCWIDPIIPD